MTTNFLKLFSLLALVAFVFASCNKDEIVPTSDNSQTEQQQAQNPTTSNPQINSLVASTTADSSACYVIDFPITFVYEDDSTVTAETEDDLDDIFGEETEQQIVDVAYPINLIDPETGETVAANNEAELIEYFVGCDFGDEDDWDDEGDDDEDEGDWDGCDDLDFDFGTVACYDLVYPVSFTLEDGSTLTVENEDDFEDLFEADNPPTDFVYPINIEDEDGETISVADENQLEDLIEDCFDGDWDGDNGDFDESVVYLLTFTTTVDTMQAGNPDACYEYVFPLTVQTGEEETLTVENSDELLELMFSDEYLEDFVYPVQLTDVESGQALTVENEDAAWELIEACFD